MSEKPLVIYISSRLDKLLADSIAQIAPGSRIVRPDDLAAHPELIEEIDIVYGNLKPEFFPRARRLQWLHTTAAGAGWTQRPEVLSHPAIITNSRIHAVQITEHLFGMLLMLVRRLHTATLNQARHVWQPPELEQLRSLPGRTLCILGVGVIGRRCAAVGRVLGMRVIGVRRRAEPVEHVEAMYGLDRLADALAQADVVMSLLPGTRESAGLMGRAQFALMPRGSLFLNAGRGSTVDTAALIEALRSGQLGGAGLDVTDPEPLPADSPLWDMPDVIITPHYAGNTADYFDQTDRIFLENLRRLIAHAPLDMVVDKHAGY